MRRAAINVSAGTVKRKGVRRGGLVVRRAGLRLAEGPSESVNRERQTAVRMRRRLRIVFASAADVAVLHGSPARSESHASTHVSNKWSACQALDA